LAHAPHDSANAGRPDAGAQDAEANAEAAEALPPAGERTLCREDFCDAWIAEVTARAARLGNYTMLSPAEREASCQSFRAAVPAGADAWIFGYGSLMWNPALHVAETRPGVVHGYHRAFALTMMMGRGSPQCPGLMLVLDRGGSCRGLLHRIAADTVDSELRILWMREMLSGAYRPRWVTARTDAGAVQAITFVANHAHPRYCGKLPPDAVVDRIARAAGNLGTNRYYLFKLVERLDMLGIADGPLHELARQVRERAERSQETRA
jgi:glutathione-specific gamma-glutamylcyclotransferase